MILNTISYPAQIYRPGIKFTSKKLLKFAIILLGLSLDIKVIANVGKDTLFVMLFTLATCFGLGFVIGKLLKLNRKTSNLISAGTGICGGSAIGLNTGLRDMKKSGVAPMLHGFIVSVLVIFAALFAEYLMTFFVDGFVLFQ